MIQTSFRKLSASHDALKYLCGSRITPGTFRRNLLRVFEQASSEFKDSQKEIQEFILAHCKVRLDADGNPTDQWEKPEDEQERELFDREIELLYDAPIELRGERIDLDDLDRQGINLSIIDLVALKEWLLFETAEFPEEIENSSEVSG